jgi:hypothetical protein
MLTENAVKRSGRVLALIVSLLLISRHLPAADSKDDPDYLYVRQLYEKIQWKDEMPDLEETNIQVDIPRAQRLAADYGKRRTQHLAWFVLAAVKEPSQLDFLVRTALKKEDFMNCWTGQGQLSRAIAALVRTPDDEKKLAPLLEKEKAFPGLIWALRNTNDPKMLKRVLDPKHDEDAMAAYAVVEFMSYRLEKKLPLEAKDAEAFLKACAYTKRKGIGSEKYIAAKIAGGFGFPWAVKALMDNIFWLEKLEIREFDSRHQNRDALLLIEKISGESFGAAATKDGEPVTVPLRKCIAWWETHSKDAKYSPGE